MQAITAAEIKKIIPEYFPQLYDIKFIDALAEVASFQNFSAGRTILDYGEYVRLVPLVITGTVKVVRENEEGKEIFLYYLNSGETCASTFSCCMAQKKSFIRTVAEEDTQLIGIPVKYADQWMMEYYVWKNFVMQAYDGRLMELIKTLDQVVFQNLDTRLWEYLNAKFVALDNPLIRTTHQDIANDLNASREAISRLLKNLEVDGKIRLGRNKILLL